MKKNNILKLANIFTLLVFSILVNISCSDNDELQDDSSKVIPTIFDFTGANKAFSGTSEIYSVLPRGGSEFIWTVTGAEMEAIPGRTDQIKVNFVQYDELASVSVYEKAANGSVSETSTIDDIKVFGPPCDWSLEMNDAYGDGWNGAKLVFTFDGFDGGEFTLEDGATSTINVPVPNGSELKVSFVSGDWDEEVTYKLYDANGTLIKEDGPTPEVGEVVSLTNSCPL